MVDRQKTLVVDGGAARIAELEAENERLERERDKWEQHACTGDDVLARTRVKLAAAESALASERAAHEARIAELAAENERLRNMLDGYGKLDAELAIAERRIEALSRTGAVKVKPLEWEEITRARSNEDPSREVVGWEASEAVSASYYTVELTGGGASMTDPDYNEKHYDDPDVAKAAAQEDYERRILSALEPAAPEGQQEPVAWAIELSGNTGELIDKMVDPVARPYAYEFGRSNGDGTYSVFIERSLPAKPHPDWPVKPLFTRPAEQAVTEAMVEAAQEAYRRVGKKHHWHPSWPGDDAMREILSAALKAAMEAGRHD